MAITVNLPQVLEDQGIKDIDAFRRELRARAHLDWHTVDDLLQRKGNITLKTLDKLCTWLAPTVGLSPRDLLVQLIEFPPGGFWDALTDLKNLNIFIPEQRYRNPEQDTQFTPWVSKHDAVVSTLFLSHLWSLKRSVKTLVRFVPFWATEVNSADDEIKWANALFDKIQSSDTADGAIFVGSPKVNGLVELTVAEMFGCKPFETRGDDQKPRVPFHVVHRRGRRLRPSCFGGTAPLPGHPQPQPGIYYCKDVKGNEWHHCRFVEGQTDSGLVIVQWRAKTPQAVRVCILGSSGWGTEVIGRELLHVKSGQFWPTTTWGDWKVGVYVCEFGMRVKKRDDGGDEIEGTKLKITALDDKVLQHYQKPAAH